MPARDAVGLAIAVLAISSCSSGTSTAPSSAAAGSAGSSPAASNEPSATAGSEAPMHDMESVTGDVAAHGMAGAGHEATSPMPASGDMASPSIAPDAHGSGDGHGDEVSDMTSDDSAGHGGGPMAFTTPSEQQRKVVLAGFAVINLLVFAGAGILRRTGHGSRGRQRAKQGKSTTPRRTSTARKDTGEQA